MKKYLMSICSALAAVLLLPAVAIAHVVVTPSQIGIGERALFDVSVPNERQAAVHSVQLQIPGGVTDVQPNVAAGWSITTTKDDSDNVTSITWSGNIPIGQRADLLFEAQAPATSGEIHWKATQTYADGTVVHWDQKPNTKASGDTTGPYSITTVTNDLSANDTATPESSRANVAFALSVAALALSLGTLFLRRRK